MKRDSFGIHAKYYDSIYQKMKNYENEAAIVQNLVKKFGKRQSKTLLDVGCGTGEHLKYLSSTFQCKGIDVNRGMIETARNKVPNARFKTADMTDFTLEEKFDVITCLFSSIGYVQDVNNLTKTLGNFYEHLNENGLALVEPWVFKKNFKKGYYVHTFEDEKTNLVRMATSEIEDSQWLIFMHYLVGEEGEIKHFEEVHRMLALDRHEYIEAFQTTRFANVEFLNENLWEGCRGLFVAVRHNTIQSRD